MDDRSLRKIWTLLVGGLASLFIFGVAMEALVRAYSHFQILYDLEMNRYAFELKIESPNPKIGHRHRPSATVRLMGVDLATNSAGFRDEEVPLARGEKQRWIFLGDSLTLGWGVKKSSTFEAILEKELSRGQPIEILNFGHGNYNTEQEVNLFLEEGLAYQPDQVVLFYFINDAEPTPRKPAWSFLGRSFALTFLWSKAKSIQALQDGPTSFERYYHNLYTVKNSGWESTQLALKTLRDTCQSAGIKLAVVLLPELHRPQKYPFLTEHAMVSQILTELQVRHLDLAPLFSQIEEPTSLWVASDDAHPNDKAHRMIADGVREFLKGTP